MAPNKELLSIGATQKRASTGSLSLALHTNSVTPEPLIVHAGAVISMLHLVPALGLDDNPQVCWQAESHTCASSHYQSCNVLLIYINKKH